MIIFNATSRRAACLSDDAITTGSVGMEVRFSCSDEWDGLSRVAVFRGSGEQVDVALTGDSCNVPPEVLAKTGGDLHIGLYGTDGSGHLVIPTVYANAGRIQRGTEPSGIEPTPQTQPLIDQLLEAAEDARDLAQSVRDDADNGAFDGEPGTPGADGENGNIIWWTSERPIASGDNAAVLRRKLHGPDGLTPAVGDYVFGPAVAEEGEPTTIYVIITSAVAVVMTALGSIKGNPGSDGYAPVVTIEQITGGHRITITSAAHPEGQVFDVMDGQGGSVTVDDEISGSSENPVQNKVIKDALDGKLGTSGDGSNVTATFTAAAQRTAIATGEKLSVLFGKILKWLSDLGTAAFRAATGSITQSSTDLVESGAVYTALAAKGTYSKPANGIPATDLESAVQTSLGKADTALQSAPVTSVNEQTGAVSLSIPSTASDVGAVAVAQGVAHAGEFVVVGSDGNITTVTMTAWSGGSY